MYCLQGRVLLIYFKMKKDKFFYKFYLTENRFYAQINIQKFKFTHKYQRSLINEPTTSNIHQTKEATATTWEHPFRHKTIRYSPTPQLQ